MASVHGGATFVAHSALDLAGIIGYLSYSDVPGPIRIIVRGVALNYPEGVSDKQLDQLIYYASSLDDSGIGVQ